MAVFESLASELMPILFKNILFNQIVGNFTCISAIIYEILIKLFFWVSPILPNTPWILVAIIDTLIPFVFFLYVKNFAESVQNIRINIRPEKASITNLVPLIILLVPTFLFIAGILPIHPRSVATASMYPEIKVGDVVIIKNIKFDEIKIGDVIEYQLENQRIIHRVIEINTEKTTKITYLIMQGDNNRSKDALPVYENQVIGKVIFKIKYIGWPSVFINNLLHSNTKVLVEIGDKQ